MHTRRDCRSCGAAPLETVLPLGEQPLANALVAPERLDQADALYPLTFAVCPRCSLGQILETVPPEELFADYLYFSSFSDTMLRHADESAKELVSDLGLGPKSLAVEVASNDGYQLRYFRERGVGVLGIEPAANVAEVAEREGIPTRVAFFGSKLADELVGEGTRADVLLAYNVLAHVPDLNGFVAGLCTLLATTGVAVIEVPHVARLVERREFDTIYHEHLCYFSLTALAGLFARHGLEIFRVREIPLHGGSLRVYADPRGARSAESSVADLVERERQEGIADASAYAGFAHRVERFRADLLERLDTLEREGASIAAYGAAAKGTVLLNYCGLRDRITFVADRSPYKQGSWVPGVRVPVVAPEELLARRPDYCLLLAWNLADEIMEQQAEYRAAGGRFIVPLPELRVL